jgi:hypothetical protein
MNCEQRTSRIKNNSIFCWYFSKICVTGKKPVIRYVHGSFFFSVSDPVKRKRKQHFYRYHIYAKYGQYCDVKTKNRQEYIHLVMLKFRFRAFKGVNRAEYEWSLQFYICLSTPYTIFITIRSTFSESMDEGICSGKICKDRYAVYCTVTL